MSAKMFPGISESGQWSYEELMQMGYSQARLARLGLKEGQVAEVQFDDNDRPTLVPLEERSWD